MPTRPVLLFLRLYPEHLPRGGCLHSRCAATLPLDLLGCLANPGPPIHTTEMTQRDRQTQELAPSTIYRWIRGECYPGPSYRARLFGLMCEPLEDGETLLKKHSDSLWLLWTEAPENDTGQGHGSSVD